MGLIVVVLGLGKRAGRGALRWLKRSARFSTESLCQFLFSYEWAQYLGHSNTAITYRTYARFMLEHLADAAEILNFNAAPRSYDSVQ